MSIDIVCTECYDYDLIKCERKEKTDKFVVCSCGLYCIPESQSHKHTFPDHTLLQRTSNPVTLSQGQHKILYNQDLHINHIISGHQ